MENIYTWQYFAIGGPAFMLGCYLTYRYMEAQYAMRKFVDEYVIKMTYGQKETARKVMDGVAADAVYGRME